MSSPNPSGADARVIPGPISHLLVGILAVYVVSALPLGYAQQTLSREYARLADDLIAGDHFEQEKAAKALAELDPRHIKDKNLRRQIARAFKTLASEIHPPDAAFQGLVNWGGKHSIPVLLELLEKDKFGNAALINAVAQFDDARCASALAARLGDFHSGKAARSALLRMPGSSAEAAVIRVAPAENEDACVAARMVEPGAFW